MSNEQWDDILFDEAVECTEEDFETMLTYFRNRDRRSIMYGEWLTSDAHADWRREQEIAEKYFAQTDAYDRRVCTGMYKGKPVPINGKESHLINKNAYQVRRALLAEYNITHQELHEAIQQYAKRERR